MQTITLRGQNIDVRELTVAEIDQVLSDRAELTIIDRVFNPDMVNERMLIQATGLDEEALRQYRPSELRPLVEAVKAENADFLAGVRSLIGADR